MALAKTCTLPYPDPQFRKLLFLMLTILFIGISVIGLFCSFYRSIVILLCLIFISDIFINYYGVGPVSLNVLFNLLIFFTDRTRSNLSPMLTVSLLLSAVTCRQTSKHIYIGTTLNIILMGCIDMYTAINTPQSIKSADQGQIGCWVGTNLIALTITFFVLVIFYSQYEELNKSLKQKNVQNMQLRKLNDALEQTNTQLEQKNTHFQKLNNTFEQTNAQLQELTEEHDRTISQKKSLQVFMGFICHEARNPLHIILNICDLMDNLDHQMAKNISIIHSSSEQILHILDDVLDTRKLEDGQLEIEMVLVDVHALIQSVCEAFKIRTKKGVQLKSIIGLGVNPIIWTDPTRFNQILYNLIGNAVKFTEEGTIIVSLSLAENKDSKLSENHQNLVLKVIDTGKGIAPDDLATLFQPWRQTKSTYACHGGSGLGLYICQQLVHMFGGTINAESAPGKGTTFIVTLSFPCGNASGGEIRRMSVGEQKRQIRRYADTQGDLAANLASWDLVDKTKNDDFSFSSRSSESSPCSSPFLKPLMSPGSKLLSMSSSLLSTLPPHTKPSTLPMARSSFSPLSLSRDLRKPSSSPLSRLRDVGVLSHRKTAGHLSPLNRKSSLLQKRLSVRRIHKATNKKERRFRILLVEDDKVNQLLFVRMLNVVEKRHNGLALAIDVAKDGQEAVDRICKEDTQYDLVFMDVIMPRMNGLTATKILREKGYTMTIIALTGNAQGEDQLECVKAGMNRIITKPYGVEQLARCIQQFAIRRAGKSHMESTNFSTTTNKKKQQKQKQ